MFDNGSEVLDALQVSVLFLSSSRISVASLSNQRHSLLPSGPISREQEEVRFLPSSCPFWVVSAVDPPVFLYSVFNKGVLKASLSPDVVFQLFNLSAQRSSLSCVQVQTMWRQRNTR